LSISSIKYVDNFVFGEGSFQNIKKIIEKRQEIHKQDGLSQLFIFYFDAYFKGQSDIINKCKLINNVEIKFIDSSIEPTTSLIDNLRDDLFLLPDLPSGLVAVGGGNTLDTVKAVSNLLNNDGNAEDYQGWDLVKNPGVYKIGVPTVSGTGAESSRTCILINEKTGLKLGMNSNFTMFDSLILDPDLTVSVPKDIFFFTISDAFFHSMEPLSGKLRNSIADAYAFMAKKLCEEIFSLDDIQSSIGRSKAMLASYFGGIAIANSMTALVHPFSTGLSVVLKTPHTLANCLVLIAMEEFYPEERKIMLSALNKHDILLPKGLCNNLDEGKFESLYKSTIVHEKPLINGLGKGFKKILTREKVREIFERI
jgi:3-deoxy-alpha-D-manno-octulosonate 8-oxidase